MATLMLYGDPAAWLKTAYDNNEYTTQVLKRFTLDGYPAVLVEFSWTVMKVPMRAINLAALEPWKAKLPAGYPLDLVPLFAVDSIDHFKKVMADAQKPDISVGTEHTEMTGVKGGFNVEIDIKYYPLINDCNVSVWLKK